MLTFGIALTWRFFHQIERPTVHDRRIFPELDRCLKRSGRVLAGHNRGPSACPTGPRGRFGRVLFHLSELVGHHHVAVIVEHHVCHGRWCCWLRFFYCFVVAITLDSCNQRGAPRFQRQQRSSVYSTLRWASLSRRREPRNGADATPETDPTFVCNPIGKRSGYTFSNEKND